MKKAIFWDFDGTLVRSNTSFLDSLMMALEKAQVAIPCSDCSGFLKSACSWYFPEDTYFDRTGELWWQTLLLGLQKFLTDHSVPVDKIPEICAGFRQNAVSYPYELYEDALLLLKAANDLGFQNYILSNNFPELSQVICRYGLEPYIKDVFLSSDIGAEKPHPAIFSAALQKAGIPSPALMVGDNPTADMEGAKAAGMTTVLVHRNMVCEKADRIYSSLSDLLPFLKTL